MLASDNSFSLKETLSFAFTGTLVPVPKCLKFAALCLPSTDLVTLQERCFIP